jgi:hypothetical protein
LDGGHLIYSRLFLLEQWAHSNKKISVLCFSDASASAFLRWEYCGGACVISVW